MKKLNTGQIMVINTKSKLGKFFGGIGRFIASLFHRHDWGKWYQTRAAVDYVQHKGAVFMVVKVRQCKKCKKLEIQ